LVAASLAVHRGARRRIYDRVLAVITGFGDDVEVLPKKTMVGFRRHRQFVCFTPASASRVDLGITLKDAAPDDPRIKPTPGGMTSHVVKVTSVDEIDEDVVGWLRTAYDRG